VLLLLGLSLPTFALAGPRSDCYGFDHLDDNPLSAELYQVEPGDKVAFECPAKSVMCRKGAFVVAGDQVVVSRIHDEWACAEYIAPGRDDETAGWLPLARLRQISPAPDWAGRWGDRDVAIVAKPQGDAIRIDAQTKMGFGHGTEYGQFAAVVDGRQSRAKFGYEAGEDGHQEKLLPYQDKAPAGVCLVRMAQLGRYLVVGDNHMCGGVNVSFSRVYGRLNEETAPAAAAAPKAASARAGSGGLRASYQQCLDRSGGVTSTMQDCIGNEYRYQDDRLNKVYRALRPKLDDASATQLRDEQRRWIAERDKTCAPDPDGGTAAMLGANDCALGRTAKRAAELEARLAR